MKADIDIRAKLDYKDEIDYAEKLVDIVDGIREVCPAEVLHVNRGQSEATVSKLVEPQSKLKPCPFDESHDLFVMAESNMYRVHCLSFGCDGPRSNSQHIAEASWNGMPGTRRWDQ